MNLTRNREVEGSIPGLIQWVKGLVLLCRLQTRLGSGVALAVALIRSLDWEPPYAASVALKSKAKQNKTKTNKPKKTKKNFLLRASISSVTQYISRGLRVLCQNQFQRQNIRTKDAPSTPIIQII